ncbi:MAG: TlpA disulfide reductase family protein [Alphaproteobacteria bacterium]
MSGVYKGLGEKLFWPGSILLVFVMFHTGSNIYNRNKLDKIELEMASEFKTLRTYENKKYLPSIKVAAPDGGVVDLSKSKGKYTILNVWATWCTPCVKELASLRGLQKSLPHDSKWRVVAVSIDSKDKLPQVAKYTSHYKVENIANYFDYNLELQSNLSVSKLPMTLIVNPSGRILYQIYGDARWHSKSILEFMDTISKVH